MLVCCRAEAGVSRGDESCLRDPGLVCVRWNRWGNLTRNQSWCISSGEETIRGGQENTNRRKSHNQAKAENGYLPLPCSHDAMRTMLCEARNAGNQILHGGILIRTCQPLAVGV